MTEELDEALAKLLRDHVDSYEKLDIVLLVCRRVAPVSVDEIATELRTSLGEVQRAVSALRSSQLLVLDCDGRVSLTATDPSKQRVEELARAYRAQPHLIASRLSRQALRRLRASAAFAMGSARRRARRITR